MAGASYFFAPLTFIHTKYFARLVVVAFGFFLVKGFACQIVMALTIFNVL